MNKIFIGGSKENIEIARTLQMSLGKRLGKQYLCKVWDESVIKPQEYTIPELIKQLKECRYSVFVFGKDDVTRSRGKEKNTARDNVVFECGLSVGILGMKNTFVLRSRDVELPSDFKGLAVVDYDEEQIKEDREPLLVRRSHRSRPVSGTSLLRLRGRTTRRQWRPYAEN